MQADNILLLDARRRPELFHWFGPGPAEQIIDWASKLGGVPEDLLSFWLTTGGGDVFESETLLSPAGALVGEDVESVTSACHQRGLPAEWVVFHVGYGVSAISIETGRYAWFEGQANAPSQYFDSLSEWYSQVLRAEYAERYGL